jgi:hypothetical protein
MQSRLVRRIKQLVLVAVIVLSSRELAVKPVL